MHSSRIATFLFGVWLGCSILLGALQFENLRMSQRLLENPIPPAAKMIEPWGKNDVGLLLHHFAWEQDRAYLQNWELLQIPLGLAIAGVLFIATDRRRMPQVLCGLMLVLVLFEHYGITPELIYRGRVSDFPPEASAFGNQARLWMLIEVYVGAEIAKLLIGGIATAYLFAYRSRRRLRRTDRIEDEPKLTALRERA